MQSLNVGGIATAVLLADLHLIGAETDTLCLVDGNDNAAVCMQSYGVSLVGEYFCSFNGHTGS